MLTSNKNPLITPIYKSYWKLLAICMNVSLSAFFVGYSLVYIGSLSIDDFPKVIVQDYGFNNLNWRDNDIDVYKSIINGAVPIGAILGALLSSQVISFFSRKNGFLVTNIPAFISIVIMVYIKNPYIFLLARLIQGICTGVFSAIVPLYINEIVTPDCTNLGSFNQILITFAQFFCYFLAYMLSLNQDMNASTSWKIIAEIPLITIIIQSVIFFFIFPFQTPKYFYQKGLIKQAADLISIIYSQDHTEQALARYTGTPSISEEQNSIAVRTDMVGVQNRINILQNSKAAIFFAIHLALLQQMSGVNAIAVYGKNTLEQAISKDMIGWISLILYVVPMIAAILTIKLMNKWGRKFFIQIGTLICAICLGALALAFFFKGNKSFDDSVPQSVIIIAGLWFFMASFGLTLGPIVWLYIPQIVQPNIIPYSTMTNLFGATLCIIGFPLIKSDSDVNIKYIPFTFFFIWCFISLFINQYLMVQTKNKPRQKIFDEYKAKKLC